MPPHLGETPADDLPLPFPERPQDKSARRASTSWGCGGARQRPGATNHREGAGNQAKKKPAVAGWVVFDLLGGYSSCSISLSCSHGLRSSSFLHPAAWQAVSCMRDAITLYPHSWHVIRSALNFQRPYNALIARFFKIRPPVINRCGQPAKTPKKPPLCTFVGGRRAGPVDCPLARPHVQWGHAHNKLIPSPPAPPRATRRSPASPATAPTDAPRGGS